MPVDEFTDKTFLSDHRTKNTLFVPSLSLRRSEILRIMCGALTFYLLFSFFFFMPSCSVLRGLMGSGPVQTIQGVLSKDCVEVMLRIYEVVRSSWTSIRRYFLTSDRAHSGTVSVQDFRKVRFSYGCLPCRAPPALLHPRDVTQQQTGSLWIIDATVWAPLVPLLSKCLKENDGEWLEIYAAHTHNCSLDSQSVILIIQLSWRLKQDRADILAQENSSWHPCSIVPAIYLLYTLLKTTLPELIDKNN